MCNITNGLYCDWLCSDYSIRVVCCDEKYREEELSREIRIDSNPTKVPIGKKTGYIGDLFNLNSDNSTTMVSIESESIAMNQASIIDSSSPTTFSVTSIFVIYSLNFLF